MFSSKRQRSGKEVQAWEGNAYSHRMQKRSDGPLEARIVGEHWPGEELPDDHKYMLPNTLYVQIEIPSGSPAYGFNDVTTGRYFPVELSSSYVEGLYGTTLLDQDLWASMHIDWSTPEQSIRIYSIYHKHGSKKEKTPENKDYEKVKALPILGFNM